MKRTRGRSALLALAFVPFLSSAGAQERFFPEDNGKALTGVKAFDAHGLIINWMNMPDSLDAERFQRDVDSGFAQTLRASGVTVDSKAPNFLFCEIAAASHQDLGFIFYSWRLSYYGYQAKGVHPLLWERSGVFTVGENKFTAEGIVATCADPFVEEWRRWNPP